MTLILIEHDNHHPRPASLRAVTAARRLSDSFSFLCIGHNIQPVAAGLANYGATKIYLADHESLAHPLADRYAKIITDAARLSNSRTLLAASSTFSRDILPRAAALLDAPMLSDVTQIDSRDNQITYHRPINAGSETASVSVDSPQLVFTIRPGSFDLPPTDSNHQSSIINHQLEIAALPAATQFVSRDTRKSERPELTEARVVVSGGRPLKDRASFDQHVGQLADLLGGAVGATRALVDAGVVPNDWQIGQTGKVIAPDLYIAMGISGSIQHLAGITDARIIVAINRDPTAPIMKIATYALVGDLFDLVPQLVDALKKSN